jgi:hypothetical protein
LVVRDQPEVHEFVFEHFGAIEGDEAAIAYRGMEELEIEGSIRPRQRQCVAPGLGLDARFGAPEEHEKHETNPTQGVHENSKRS